MLRKTQVSKFTKENHDSFTASLIEGEEAKLLKCDKEIDPKTALKLEFESRSLPVVPQLCSNETLISSQGLLFKIIIQN